MGIWDTLGGWAGTGGALAGGLVGGVPGAVVGNYLGGGNPGQAASDAYHIATDPNRPDPNFVIDPHTWDNDKNRLGTLLGQQSPYTQAQQVGRDPYGGGWGQLVSQLQNQANGTGPSAAQQAYRTASQDSMGQLSGMAAGSASPGAAREAMLQQGRIGQGMASGLASARTQEQMAAQGMLGQALTGAGNSAFQRDSLNAQLQQQNGANNQNAWLNILGQQLGLNKDQLQAMLGNQNYAATVAGQPNGLQRLLQGLSAGAGTVAAVT